MSLLDEQLVEEWLNRQGFFTMRGIKCGVDEIDLLAIRERPEGMDRWHVEVQISFNPIGYIGGGPSAKRRTPEEVRAGVVQWVDKKFTKAIKSERRLGILPESEWQYVLVHGISRHPVELGIMNELGDQGPEAENETGFDKGSALGIGPGGLRLRRDRCKPDPVEIRSHPPEGIGDHPALISDYIFEKR
jgi:hypothetical protein